MLCGSGQDQFVPDRNIDLTNRFESDTGIRSFMPWFGVNGWGRTVLSHIIGPPVENQCLSARFLVKDSVYDLQN